MVMRSLCECLISAVVCEACGTPCRWFEIPSRGRMRFHLSGHAPGPGGPVSRAVFNVHSPEECARTRESLIRYVFPPGSF